MLHSRSHKSTPLTCLFGRATHEGETATGNCAHTRTRGEYIRELDDSKCADLWRKQEDELRARPLVSPWPLHCPPTCLRSRRARMNALPLRLGTITATPQRACAVGHMQ